MTDDIKFVKQYEPGSQARVELVNGRIVDVVHGRYHKPGTRVILQGGKIVAMPGRQASPLPASLTLPSTCRARPCSPVCSTPTFTCR